ncbi:class I SAM-dependent methyltransferase [Hymenobacter sp.]|jgi:SAM-dependent methyltransferase|uniref:class I SAM-dependent methyltransferase n=1 Tax=Hymenobacter sp. TaxID=1898978 RepID=UPI002ED89601
MNIHKECLLCSGSELVALPEFNKAQLVQCKACDFVFCGPVPTPEELSIHYSWYPRNDDISPITIKRYNELLDGFEKYRKTGKILDVGCGNGHFLVVAKQRGWEVYGTEFSEEAVAIGIAKGINMLEGQLDVANYQPESFDVITSFEVLEHINNPIDEVNKFKALLRPRGLLYLTTPNFNSVLRYYLKEKWSVIEYPEHLTYYTASTLKKLMAGNGFAVERIYTTGISIGRLKAASAANKPSADNQSVGAAPAAPAPGFRQVDEQLRSLEGNPLADVAKVTVNWLLNISRKGDALKGYFVKK